MRNIGIVEIIEAVRDMCISANCVLNDDIYSGLKQSISTEKSEIGKDILEKLVENADLAKEKYKPICQDTGMAIVFVEIGQEVHIEGGNLEEAIQEGVRQGYKLGYLRKSVVSDPLMRINSGDNTPAIIYYKIVDGDKLKIEIAPKGFGSENMSKIFMLKPSDGIKGVKKAIIDTIEMAGPNPCPPMVVGVGIGGDFEYSAYLAKRALLRPIGQRSEIAYIRDLEEKVLVHANKLGIGPQGTGGTTTVLGVNIETYATHIAGLPVAINIGCHVTRHASKIL